MSAEFRDALREQFAEARANDAEPVESAPDAGAVDEVAAVDAESASVAEGAQGGDGASVAKPDGRQRNADGTYAKTPAEKAAAKAEQSGTKAPVKEAASLVKPKPVAAKAQTPPPAQAAESVAAPAAPKYKPPQGLRPTVREKWADLPETWQEEIDRLEREAKVGIQKNAEAAKFREAFQAAVQPYQAMLGGADPVRAVSSLMQTAYALQTSPPAHKAQLVARIIKDYGVNIDELAAAIEGSPQTQARPQSIDPDALLRQAEERVMKRLEAERAEKAKAEAASSVGKFAEEHEFFDRVRLRMSGLLQGGVVKDLESAYNESCWADPEVRAVLLQREKAKQASADQALTQRKAAASSSVKSQPAAEAPRPAATNMREALREELAAARRGK